jgi:replication-associated recombination protein RarA
MSAMQKVLRWGRDDLALSAAATLLRDAPDKLWRRISCIAYEDIGVAYRRRPPMSIAEIWLKRESPKAQRWSAVL